MIQYPRQKIPNKYLISVYDLSSVVAGNVWPYLSGRHNSAMVCSHSGTDRYSLQCPWWCWLCTAPTHTCCQSNTPHLYCMSKTHTHTYIYIYTHTHAQVKGQLVIINHIITKEPWLYVTFAIASVFFHRVHKLIHNYPPCRQLYRVNTWKRLHHTGSSWRLHNLHPPCTPRRETDPGPASKMCMCAWIE